MKPFLIVPIALVLAAPVLAAPGDATGPLRNIAEGGIRDHDPYFKDFSRPQGTTALKNGNLVVGWTSRASTKGATPTSPDGDGYGSFFRVYNSSGVPLSAAPTAPYLDINSAGTGRQNSPRFVALNNGGFVVAWNSAGGPTDTYLNGNFGGDAYYRVYDGSGNPVSGTARLNENDPNGAPDQQEPVGGVALSDGGFALLWNDQNAAVGNNTDDLFVRAFNANGTARGGSTRIGGTALDNVQKTFSGQFGGQPGIVALSGGRFALCFNSNGATANSDGDGDGAYFQVFNSDGSALISATRPYADINSAGTGDQGDIIISGLKNGGFMVSWNSVDGPGDVFSNTITGGDTYIRVFNDSGTAVSTTSKVNDLRNDNTESPAGSVALSDGGFAIVWHEDEDSPDPQNANPRAVNQDDYYVRAYNANGTARGSSVFVGLSGGAVIDSLFEDFNADSDLLALPDGGFVVGLRVRDFNNDGTGTSFDGGGYAAMFQVFNANGTTRTGVVFPYKDINPDGSGNQNTPLLAVTTEGFAVTWNSNKNTNDGANSDRADERTGTFGGDVYTRLYNNSGTPISGTKRVNDDEPTGYADQQDPFAIQALTGGGYAVLIKDENGSTSLPAELQNTDDFYLRFFTGGATNRAPVAGDDSYATNEDTQLVVPASGVLGNDNDPDNNTLSITSNTNPAHGSLVLNANGSFTYTPQANYNGTDTFNYTISDGTLSDTGTVTITVRAVNDVPTIATPSNQTVAEDSGSHTVALTGISAGPSNESGQTVTLSATSNNPSVVPNPTISGYDKAAGTATLTFSSLANANGQATITVTATDNGTTESSNGTSNDPKTTEVTFNVTVTAVNDAPVARNDTYNTAFGTSLTVPASGVLGNDSDVENSALSVADGDPSTPNTIDPVQAPANGVLTLNANGSFTYTPNSGFTGADTFTYRVSDGQTVSNVATVTINIAANVAPVAVNDSTSTSEDTFVDINVVVNDTDADGGTLRVAAGSISNVKGGTAVLQSDGKTVRFTPTANANSGNTPGGFGFTYQVSDGTATSQNTGSVTVTVTPVNDTPVIASVAITPASPNTNSVLTANVNASDVDGDTLSYTYVWKKNGTPINGQTGSTLNLATAGNGDNGDTITVTVTANDGSVNSAAVTSDPVTVGNSAPTITSVSIAPTSPNTNSTLTATVVANDADNDTLSYTYVWKKNGTIITGETGNTLDLSKTGNGDKDDTITVTVTANDGTTNSAALASAGVTVVNSAPTVTSVTLAPASPNTNSTLTATVVASDADNDSLTYTYIWRKNGTVITGETGKTLDLSKAGNGDDGDSITVTVVANDGTTNSASLASQPVVVQNSAPTITSVTLTPATPLTNETLTATVVANDADGNTLSYTYVWRKNGTVIAGETGKSLDLSKVGNGNKGDRITVTVTANDGTTNSASATSAEVTVGNSAPIVRSVTLAPISPNTNALLTATVTGADADDDGLTYTYVWRRNGTIIDGESGKTLDLSKAGNGDKGDSIIVTVTANDGTSDSVSVNSNSVAVVNSAPSISIVTLTPGAPLTTSVLTANVVASDIDNDKLSYTYVWKKNGTILTGETGPTLDLSKAGNGDDGDTITVTVVANDGSANSNPLASASVSISNRTPVVESVTPQGATDKVGDKRTFSITVSDENGAGDIKEAWLLVNERLNWSEGATFIYVPNAGSPTTGLLYLRRGDAFLPPIQIGAGASSTDVLDNGAVRVVGSEVTVTVTGNSLTLSIPATIREGLVGNNTLFGFVLDKADAKDTRSLAGDDGFIRFGPYTVTSQFSGPNVAPVLSKLSPGATYTALNASGVAPGAQRFVFYVSDDNGISDIESVWFLAGKQLNWSNSATVVYQPRTRRLFLRSDDGSTFLGGGQIGQAGIIENSQVRIDLSKVTVNLYPDGKSFGLTLFLQAKKGLLGQNTIWLRAQDKAGTIPTNSNPQGYVQSGTWSVVQGSSAGAVNAPNPSNGNS